MLRFIYSQIYGMAVAFIQILLIEILIYYDKDLSDVVKKLQKVDVIVIIIQALAAESWVAILTPMDSSHTWLWLQTHLFIVLFIVQSFVDNKIKQIYDILTIQVICFQIVTAIDQNLQNVYAKGENMLSVDRIFPILIVVGILGLITIFNGLGAGDFLIYIALAIHYTTFQLEPWFIFTVSILIGQCLFMVYTTIESIILKKDFRNNKPFTMFLQIAAIISFA